MLSRLLLSRTQHLARRPLQSCNLRPLLLTSASSLHSHPERVTLCPLRSSFHMSSSTMSSSTVSSSPSASASASAPASAPPAPIFSPDQPQDLPARVDALVHWRLTASRKGLTRTFTFASFAKAWAFMARVADECKAQRHHPEWSNLYNRVTVEWTTHRPEGLSIKDAHMADFCDRVAAEIGLKE